ncbi:MAG: hypothetical protein ACRD96_26905, partial [Bryobacteraceae bacterium]
MRIYRMMMAGVSCAGWMMAQDTDRVSVAFSDPSRPGLVRASLLHGSITVKGYAGKEVVVEAKRRNRGAPPAATGGLKRLEIGTTGLEVEEENNVMKVGAASHRNAIDLVIQVPSRTNLKLNATNDGHITVEQVQGD